jgi:hypothetical protein
MLGFTLLHRDASRVELLHVRSGTTFTFALSEGKPSDKCLIAPDVSGDFSSPIKVDYPASIERLASLARMAAGLHLPTECVESPVPLGRLPAGAQRLCSNG